MRNVLYWITVVMLFCGPGLAQNYRLGGCWGCNTGDAGCYKLDVGWTTCESSPGICTLTGRCTGGFDMSGKACNTEAAQPDKVNHTKPWTQAGSIVEQISKLAPLTGRMVGMFQKRIAEHPVDYEEILIKYATPNGDVSGLYEFKTQELVVTEPGSQAVTRTLSFDDNGWKLTSTDGVHGSGQFGQ
jgi:hypothetical protein